MKVLRFDSGVKWGDKNARWGSPSYLLEPGEPGYVHTGPVPGPANPTHSPSKAMSASNETPRNQNILLPLAHDMLAGMTSLQDTVGLHHHRDTTLRPRILALEGDPTAAAGSNANKGSQLVYKLAADAAGAALSAMIALSEGVVKTLLMAYRSIMEGVHGKKLNAGWAAAGFTDNTAVPKNHNKRFALLTTARAYLAANPGQEATVPQPGGTTLAITAANALTVLGQFDTARTLVNTADGAAELCKQLRDADVDALFAEVSGTTSELRGLLAADDARWENFGLNIPASPNPPEAVTALTVTASGTGQELVQWQRARRATYYRVFRQVDGVDAEPQFAGRDSDLEFTLKDLTPGTTVHVYVVAANDGGEAAPSPTVTKVVGA